MMSWLHAEFTTISMLADSCLLVVSCCILGDHTVELFESHNVTEEWRVMEKAICVRKWAWAFFITYRAEENGSGKTGIITT